MLVINRCPLEARMSHQQALLLLQQPGDTVELVVARDGPVSASSPRVSTHLSSTVRGSEKPGSPPGGGGPGGERVVSLGRGQRSLWPVNL